LATRSIELLLWVDDTSKKGLYKATQIANAREKRYD
jgi:hypothetical protein